LSIRCQIIAADPNLFVGGDRFQGKSVRRRINRFHELLFSNEEPGAVNFEPFFLHQFGRTFMAQFNFGNFKNSYGLFVDTGELFRR